MGNSEGAPTKPQQSKLAFKNTPTEEPAVEGKASAPAGSNGIKRETSVSIDTDENAEKSEGSVKEDPEEGPQKRNVAIEGDDIDMQDQEKSAISNGKCLFPSRSGCSGCVGLTEDRAEGRQRDFISHFIPSAAIKTSECRYSRGGC